MSDEQEPKTEPEEDLSILEGGDPFKGPLLWIVLLLVPVILSLVVSFVKSGEDVPDEAVTPAAVEEQVERIEKPATERRLDYKSRRSRLAR